jgi:hypothetical protein
MPLDPAKIERLRAVLNPRRERFDFAYTMNRWASEVSACDDARQPEFSKDGTDWDALVAEILERIPVMFVNRRSQRGSENSCILRD